MAPIATILSAIIGTIAVFLGTPFMLRSLASFPLSYDLAAPITQNSSSSVKHNSSAWHLSEHLGGNSPWMPKTRNVSEYGIEPPKGCRVEQVHMLSRHAERYPTAPSGMRMIQLVQRAWDSNVTFQGDLAFLNDWDFFVERPSQDFDQLVSTGPNAGTLGGFNTGVKMRTRYMHLIEDAFDRQNTTFWASDSRRVIDTARYFGAGFFGIDWERLTRLVVISEESERGANTLTPGRTCSRYRNGSNDRGHDYGYRMREAFRSTYEPSIVSRLHLQNPDFLLTEDEVFTMQEMCGFEIIARGLSQCCDVFTREDWENFEYARDILHYYRAGPGNPYSGSMGWLWLNESLNLLEIGPSAGPLFFSFVHDGDVLPVLTVLNLLSQDLPLPATHALENRTWRTSDVVPMGGRIILERLTCQAPPNCWSNAPLYPNHLYCEPLREDVFVRINVNDGIMTMADCDSGPGDSCPLGQFLNFTRERGKEFEDFGDICGLSEDAAKKITFLQQ